MEKTTGILLRTKKFSETSLLVYWCTNDLGIVHTVARGARRPKSPYSGKLDLFYTADLAFARSRKSDLHNLSEVSVLTHRSGIQKDYLRVLAASYFVQLIELVAEPEAPIPELYELLDKALDFLDEQPCTVRVIERFELRIVQYSGIAEEGKAPHNTIWDVFGRLPKSRSNLIDLLP